MDSRARVNLSTAFAYAPYGIIWTFLPVHLYSLGASLLLISLIFFVPALLPPVWGLVLDKVRRGKQILVVSILAQAVGFTVFPFLSTPNQFVSVTVLVGLFTASFAPVYAALATWSSHQYGRAIGRFWVYATLGFAASTIVGGLIYETYGANYLFYLGIILGYAGVLATASAPKEAFYSPVNALANSQGLLRLLKTRSIAILCAMAALIIIASTSFNSFFTVYLVDSLHGSTLLAGIAASGTTLLGAVVYRTVGPLNDSLGRRPVFLAGALGYVAYFVAILLVKDALIAAVLWVIPIYPLIQSSTAALVSDYTSTSDRGKGLGLLGSATGLGGGIGPVMGGLINDSVGAFDSVIIFALGTSLVTLLLAGALLKEQRRTVTVVQQVS